MIYWETGDIIKIKGKAYEVWEIGDNNLILRSLCSSHYFLTLHNTNPILQPYAKTKTTQPERNAEQSA